MTSHDEAVTAGTPPTQGHLDMRPSPDTYTDPATITLAPLDAGNNNIIPVFVTHGWYQG